MDTSPKMGILTRVHRAKFLINNPARCVSFLLTAFTLFIVGYDNGYAEMRTRQCDSVLNMAEIEFHSKLIVNTVKDKDRQLCKFYVYMPPNFAENTAVTNMVAKYSDLYVTQDAEATLSALQGGFQFDFINVLLEPLNSPDLYSESAKLLITSVNNSSALIEQCIYDSLIKQMPYMELNDTISCGLSNSQSEFIIEATSPSISVSLRIPLA